MKIKLAVIVTNISYFRDNNLLWRLSILVERASNEKERDKVRIKCNYFPQVPRERGKQQKYVNSHRINVALGL